MSDLVKAYSNIIKNSSVERVAIEIFLEDLNSEPSLKHCDTIEYSISSRQIQRGLKEKRSITASTIAISRSLKAFLADCELREGKDYEIRGSPRKYIFEKLKKKKIDEMNMKFKYNEN